MKPQKLSQAGSCLNTISKIDMINKHKSDMLVGTSKPTEHGANSTAALCKRHGATAKRKHPKPAPKTITVDRSLFLSLTNLAYGWKELLEEREMELFHRAYFPKKRVPKDLKVLRKALERVVPEIERTCRQANWLWVQSTLRHLGYPVS